MSAAASLCWAAGVLRPTSELRPQLGDRAFRYGDGVFATLSLRAGRLLDAREHLERLAASAGAVGLSVPASVDSAAGLLRILDLMRVPADAEGVVRVQVSARPGGRGYDRTGPSAWELVEVHPPPAARTLTVAVLEAGEAPVPALPGVKSCSALAHVMCARAARERGCAEAVRTAQGHVLEASASNVFWANGGELFTPSASLPLYPGITRSVVLETAQRSGWTVREGEFAPSDLRSCDGAFLTNAARGVEPIHSLGGADLAWPPALEELRRSVETARMEAGLPIGGTAGSHPRS